MATCLKRSSKLFELSGTAVGSSSGRAGRASNNSGGGGGGGGGTSSHNNNSGASSSGSSNNNNNSASEPTLRELICPVCRTILREPVTLPCAHNLCLRCLQGTVQHNSLSCPLCRQRVGSWLRARTKAESLVNAELWQLIRRRYPEELESALASGTSAADATDLDLDPEFTPKKKISAAGEIRREYEIQLQMAEEEIRREREKERIASEALIRKIQEEEEQQKLVQLAQDQLLAKTLAKREVSEKTNDKHERSSRAASIINLDKSKPYLNQSKIANNPKMSVKSKNATDTKKQNVALISKVRSERYASSVKSSTSNVQKEATEVFSSQKPVPIHNAVTRVVTHQSRVSQPNNSTYPNVLGDLIGSTSKIYGLQSKEELHVPSDVLSSKKKKLGVEVCVTTVEGEERIGSAESAGSHDSINQEIHHFKPIKALPRTPLRITLDGRQIDPKLIRVLPILKRVSNVVPKPPTPTLFKKMFGCSWSAFKRISRQQQVLQKDSPINQQQETKKTEKKSEQTQSSSKSSSKSLQDLDERNVEMAFDSNKNYTKNVNKIINGTKVSKKLNLDDQPDNCSSAKQTKRTSKMKNGLLPQSKHKSQKESNGSGKVIEVVDIEDDERESPTMPRMRTPDPLACTPKIEPRPPSPVLELAMENIAERIKKRKTTRTVAHAERSTKAKSKKIGTKGRKQKTKKITVSPKTKTKKKSQVVVTSVTSQIKRLAARSAKRPRYTEDTESEEEPEDEQREQEPMEEQQEQQPEVTNEAATELDRSEPSPSPSPPKKARKSAKVGRKPKKKASAPVETSSSTNSNSELPQNDIDEDEVIIKEQERLERLAAQERKDRELALELQARFNAMERIAGRTRRGTARLPSPLLCELGLETVDDRRPQKRAAIK